MDIYYINITGRLLHFKPNDYVQVIDLNDLVREKVLVSDLLTVMDNTDCWVLNASRRFPTLDDDSVLVCYNDTGIFVVGVGHIVEERDFGAFKAKAVGCGFYIYLKELERYLLFLNRGVNATIQINDLIFPTGDDKSRDKVRILNSDLELRSIYRTGKGYRICVRFGCYFCFYINVFTDGRMFVRSRYAEGACETALFTKQKLFLSL